MTQHKRLDLRLLMASCAFLQKSYHENMPLGDIGLSVDMFQTLTQEQLWLAQDRQSVERSLQSLRDGIAHSIGFVPFKVPAEHCAAIILGFVNPVNYQTACAWLAGKCVPGSDIAAGEGSTAEPVSAEQLFTLVLMGESQCPEFEHFYNSKTMKLQAQAEHNNNA